jgi:HSP20 family protein
MQNMLEKFREGGVADDKFPPFKGLISSYPKIDMINKEDEIIISIDLPGVEKDNIELEIFEKYLTLSGKRSAEYEQKSEDYLLSEKSYGEFRRTVRFPSKVDIDKTETDYKDGVLKLVLPKIEPEKPKSRKIEI